MKIERKHVKETIDVVDSAGQKHKVIIFTPMIEVQPTFQSPGRFSYMRSNERIELSDRRSLNRIDEDTFEVITTGEILKRLG